VTLEKAATVEFEAILARFSSSIKSSVLKFGLDKRGVDPEDVLQEIRMKVWKRTLSEKKIRHPASYINTVVNSTLIDCLRRSRREARIIQQEKDKKRMEARGKAKPLADHQVPWNVIGQAADLLLEARRQAVKLFLLNMTIEEIALSLDWSPDKARNLVYRGLSDMRKILKERGIEYDHQQ
jgi:RNA polymerase sigma-70 factor (ECF subfamily)